MYHGVDGGGAGGESERARVRATDKRDLFVCRSATFILYTRLHFNIIKNIVYKLCSL